MYELRRVLDTGRNIRRVRAWATAEGIYELFVNGQRTGDLELSPGFTSYRTRLQMSYYDLTSQWTTGANTITARLSDGWFRGQHGLERRSDNFGEHVAFALELELEFEDGSCERIGSDQRWDARSTRSTADLMHGERVELHSADTWESVTTHGNLADDARLVGQLAPPARAIERKRPISVSEFGRGNFVIDFGQNINGWARLRVPAGAKLTLSYGEWLDKGGHVYRDNLRGLSLDTFAPTDPGQQDTLIGQSVDTWVEPRHSTKGFRYLEIEGYYRTLGGSDVEGVHVQTALERTGHFTCSDDRVNQLHEAVVWSFKDNALEIPTDCPQRERSGFTGDWQVFFPTASFLFDVAGFTRKWLHDLAADQDPVTGRVSTVVPTPKLSGRIATMEGSAGWGDAAVIVPWLLWTTYGDVEVLKEQYESMVGWVEFSRNQAVSLHHPSRTEQPQPHHRYLWDGGFHFGEWLEPGEDMGPGNDQDHGAVATAYYYRSVSLLARISGILGKQSEEASYHRLAAAIRQAWRTEYLDTQVTITPHKQASYVRAIAFGLLDPQEIEVATGHLIDLIAQANGHLGTGFLSTADLLPVLAEAGHADVAYRVLTSTGVPSWFEMIRRGSTTVWEKWDAFDDEGRPSGSLNHYSKGAVAAFLHRYVGGIRPAPEATRDTVGYQQALIAPLFIPELDWAEASLATPRGLIRTRWSREGDLIRFTATLPPLVRAEIRVPGLPPAHVHGGTHEFTTTTTLERTGVA